MNRSHATEYRTQNNTVGRKTENNSCPSNNMNTLSDNTAALAQVRLAFPPAPEGEARQRASASPGGQATSQACSRSHEPRAMQVAARVTPHPSAAGSEAGPKPERAKRVPRAALTQQRVHSCLPRPRMPDPNPSAARWVHLAKARPPVGRRRASAATLPSCPMRRGNKTSQWTVTRRSREATLPRSSAGPLAAGSCATIVSPHVAPGCPAPLGAEGRRNGYATAAMQTTTPPRRARHGARTQHRTRPTHVTVAPQEIRRATPRQISRHAFIGHKAGANTITAATRTHTRRRAAWTRKTEPGQRAAIPQEMGEVDARTPIGPSLACTARHSTANDARTRADAECCQRGVGRPRNEENQGAKTHN